MPNDIPDWTGQQKVNLVGGISGKDLGDLGAAQLTKDSVTETISTAGTPLTNLGAVLASFKAAAASVIAQRGNLGAFTVGSNTAVTPAFGQATAAGNLLVAWTTANGTNITCSDGTWVSDFQAGITAGVQVWHKANCGANEVAPTFNQAGGLSPMFAQLGEFTGAATVNPTDQVNGIQNPPVTDPITVTLPTVDVNFGDLVVWASRWTQTASTTATFTDAFNTVAAPVRAGDSGSVARLVHSCFSYGIVAAATVGWPVGEAPWPYDVIGFSAPATGSLATVTLAASPSKAYVAAFLAAAIDPATAVTTAQYLFLKDGSTVLFQHLLAVVATIGAMAQFSQSGLAYRGTVNVAMSWALQAGVANIIQTVSIGAYLR